MDTETELTVGSGAGGRVCYGKGPEWSREDNKVSANEQLFLNPEMSLSFH